VKTSRSRSRLDDEFLEDCRQKWSKDKTLEEQRELIEFTAFIEAERFEQAQEEEDKLWITLRRAPKRRDKEISCESEASEDEDEYCPNCSSSDLLMMHC
jgi:hypothetical protein